MNEERKNDKIKDRESWLKVLVIALFSVIIAWKILTSPISIDIIDFRISDLLAVILSIFAILLSASFYFKGTDASNMFYDNTYKFTKDISEMLGKIEAEFGEQLKHLNEDYTFIRDKFDRLPDITTAKEQVEKEGKEVKEKEKERDQLFENLAEKAKLQEKEKIELFEQLKSTEYALQMARNKLASYEKQLATLEYTSPYSREEAFTQLRDIVGILGARTIISGNSDVISKKFGEIKYHFSMDPKVLKALGIVDINDQLTEKGIKVLKDIAKHNM